MVVMLSPFLRALSPTFSHAKKQPRHVVERVYEKSMEEFMVEARALFEEPLELQRLLAYSEELQEEYKARLQSSDISMLPSYQHTLPTGLEEGDFLALDVGGSTFRVALVKLCGKKDDGESDLQIRRIRSLVIDKSVRDLRGQAFFDWMAERIGEILIEYNHINGTTDARLPMGLAWSFPIEQTDPRSGKLLPMGKGFRATHGCEGEDLSELIMRSCRQKEVNVEMRAIVNDGAATLVSQAYRDPTARMSLILGTGMNAAVFLPVSALASEKYGERPKSWYAAAEHVLVNTELSMFGKHVLPTTRWDNDLNEQHQLPDFQPMEYLVTGRYLGEIARLVVLEAITSSGLFDGQVPEHFNEPYAFDTKFVAAFESDESPNLANASADFLRAHRLPSKPRLADWKFMQTLATLISHRAEAYLATALHALWRLRTASEGLEPGEASHVTIACNGTLVEKYPGFRSTCQGYIDELCTMSGASKGAVTLEMAPESSIFGAAVAVCCLEDA